MKTLFAVVLGIGMGAGSMYGWQAYQEHQAEQELQAAFENVDENVKTFMRCMGMSEDSNG